MRASEIAAVVGGTFDGVADPELRGVAPIDEAGPDELSFLAHPRYLSYLERARPGTLLVGDALAERVRTGVPVIVVPDVHRALAEILPRLHPAPSWPSGIHPTAVIGPGAELGEGVGIGAYAVVGDGVRLGRRARLGSHVVVGAGSVLGDDVVLHPHVTVYPGVRIGDRSEVHSGARIGSDGFGYAFGPDGHRKVPQIGGCEVGADVEIGANTTIDRGSIGVTRIGDGVKIDNLVHVGHNVRIGAGSVIVAQVGISGSTRIGRGVTLAGQAGIAGHIEIADGATVGAQAGVIGDLPPGAVVSGYPARPHKEAMRAQAGLFRLPELVRRIRELEARVFGKEDSR